MTLRALSFTFGFVLSVFCVFVTSSGESEIRSQPAVATPQTVSDGELKAFAKADVKFQEIRAEYEPKWGSPGSFELDFLK
jgi:hypothetical protein